MTVKCAECEKFKTQFIAVQNERTKLLLSGKVTAAVLRRLEALDHEEMAALWGMMDHKIEHRLSKA